MYLRKQVRQLNPRRVRNPEFRQSDTNIRR